MQPIRLQPKNVLTQRHEDHSEVFGRKEKAFFRFEGYQQVCMPAPPQHPCSKQSAGPLPEPAGSLLCAKRNLSMRNLRRKIKFSQVVVRRRAAQKWFPTFVASCENQLLVALAKA